MTTKTGQPVVKNRIKVAALASVLGALVLVGRLTHLQIVRAEAGARIAEKITSKNLPWKASRGLIRDRNGRKLVANSEFYTLVAHPKDVLDPAREAALLSPIVGRSQEALRKGLASDSQERVLRRRLSPAAVRELRSLEIADATAKLKSSHRKLEPLKIPGLALRREPDRNYLKRELAGQVIGHVDIDNVGKSGMERFADSQLVGPTSTVQVRRYGDRRTILESDYSRLYPIRGADVLLTLDETIQWMTERALNDQCEKYEAKAGMAIVMKPENGEILAMANYPSFDPKRVGLYATQGEMFRAKNHCILDLFEPGSTMKPFIVAAALEEGVVTPDTIIDCQGGYRYLPKKIRPIPIVDVHRVGRVTVSEVLEYSSNIGAGKIAELIVYDEEGGRNSKKLYDYLTAFGFGQKTGVDLPGETQMMIRPSWERWGLGDILVLSFGTGPIMVTPVGLAEAYCVLANGGVRVTPRVTKGLIGNRDQVLYQNRPGQLKRVLSEKTARQVREMLYQVVEGEGSQARSEWYSSGGKTGTAKKVVDGRYSKEKRLLSFAGMAPALDPEIVVVVMIDEAKGLQYGNQAAAPVFKRIVEDTLAYLHVAPDPNRKGFQEMISALEEARVSEAEPEIAEPGNRVATMGENDSRIYGRASR